MKKTVNKAVWKPYTRDANGKPVPHYIVHGGPELSRARGLPSSECNYFDSPPTSEEHRRNREAMWDRWVAAGAEHVYPED